jgi:adenosylhomocysteine nucleosidase
MKIGIIGAMAEEVEHLTRDIEARQRVTTGRRDYIAGMLFGRDVVVAFSRWGKVAAAATTTTLIERFGVDFVVFTGVAGAAAPHLEIGDIVVASATMQYDLDVSALPGLERFEVPLLGISRFPVGSDLQARARLSAETFISSGLSEAVSRDLLNEFGIGLPRVICGLVASGDRFIADQASLCELQAALPDLQCVEMEGGAVAQVCYEYDIPMTLFRVISDKADHSAVIDFPAFVSKIASPITAGIVRDFVRSVV